MPSAMPKKVIDNLKEGEEVDVGEDFWWFFEAHLKKEFMQQPKQKGDNDDHQTA